MKKRTIACVLAVCLAALLIVGCSQKESGLPQFEAPKKGSEVAVITTSMGEMKFMLFSDLAPNAVAQFKALAEAGFYNGAPIGRLLGDHFFETTSGKVANLTPVADEYSMSLWHFYGALGFAKDTSGSASNEICVVTASSVSAETLALMQSIEADSRGRFPDAVMEKYEESGGVPELDGRYGVFGQLYEGFTVLSSINAAETEYNEETSEQSTPVEPITITSVKFETVA